MTSSLHRELNVTSCTALVISNMIGTGIFTTTGYLAGDLGRPMLVLVIWITGAIVALAGALVYAELGVNLPRSGGEYAYLREAWGPLPAFLSGWVSFIAGFCAPIAAASLAVCEYLGHFFPSLAPSQIHRTSWLSLHLGPGQLVAIGLIAAFALINVRGLGIAARLQNALTALKLAVIGAFLTLGIFFGHGSWSHFSVDTSRTSSHSISAQFGVSLVFVMFSYSGWNAASYVAEEMKSPERTLPRALLLGTGLVSLLYLALNAFFIYALPLESLKGVVPVGAATATALLGSRAGDFFSAMMAAALLSCISAMSLAGPRVYYAMAQDGCFPSAAARVDPRWGTPAKAIIFQAMASAIMAITGTFEALIYYIGITLILFPALAIAGLPRLRKRSQWRRLRAVSWCYPAVPAIFLVASLWMLTWTLIIRPRESLLALLTVFCGGLLYRWELRRGWISRRPVED